MKKVLILFVAIIIFASCKKKDQTIYLSEDIKRNFSFKPGSYWIYRDSISGREDSCYLSNSQNFIPNQGRSDPSPFEILTISLIQKPVVNTTSEEINWLLFFSKGVLEVQYKNSKASGSIQVFKCRYPIDMAKNKINVGSIEGSTIGLSKFLLNGNAFDTVYEINTFDTSQSGYSFNNTCFINDSVGFIKMSINYVYLGYGTTYDTTKVHEVWELQRCKIVR